MCNKGKGKLVCFIVIILIAFGLNYYYGWSDYLSDLNNLRFLQKMVQDHLIIALIVYVCITIVGCVILALPGVTFALLAGILFGPVSGSLACLSATTIGAAFAFLVGRFFLKDSIKPMLEKNKVLNKLLFSKSDKNDIIILMITRMIPIFPYNLQNFAYGITDIGFWKYTLLTFVFMSPGVTFFTIGAAGITAGDDKWRYFIIAGVLALIVIIFGMLLRKKYLSDSEEMECMDDSGK